MFGTRGFSVAHGAAESGDTQRDPTRNFAGHSCPPSVVTPASTSRFFISEVSCPRMTVFLAGGMRENLPETPLSEKWKSPSLD
jgi:hypothetical protein